MQHKIIFQFLCWSVYSIIPPFLTFLFSHSIYNFNVFSAVSTYQNEWAEYQCIFLSGSSEDKNLIEQGILLCLIAGHWDKYIFNGAKQYLRDKALGWIVVHSVPEV